MKPDRFAPPARPLPGSQVAGGGRGCLVMEANRTFQNFLYEEQRQRCQTLRYTRAYVVQFSEVFWVVHISSIKIVIALWSLCFEYRELQTTFPNLLTDDRLSWQLLLAAVQSSPRCPAPGQISQPAPESDGRPMWCLPTRCREPTNCNFTDNRDERGCTNDQPCFGKQT